MHPKSVKSYGISEICVILMGLLRSRRSIRRFADRPVEPERLARLVEAAGWAPSNHNRQGWKFIVFRERAMICELSRKVRESLTRHLEQANRLLAQRSGELLHYATLFDQAPVVVLAMHKKTPAVGRALLEAAGAGAVSSEALSAAMAVQNFLLAAHAEGLGACVMTAPLLAADVWAGLDLPVGFEPTCLIALGWPDEAPPPPRRKPPDQIVEYR